MEAILVSVLTAIVEGESVGTVLTAITSSQWVTLAIGVGETIEPKIASLLGLPAPSFSSLGELVDSVAKTFADGMAKKDIGDWLAANADAAIKEQPGIEGQ
jgi:hypothetical protein